MFVCFDTSAVNALYDDSNALLVATAVRAKAMLRPTEFNVMEIIQTASAERRRGLLKLLGTFVDGTLPLTLPTLIVRRIAQAQVEGQKVFSTEIGQQSADVLRALESPELIDEYSRDIGRRWSAYVNGEFDSIAVGMREQAQAARGSGKSPWFRSASALMRYQMFDPGEHYAKFTAAMYLLETGRLPSDDDLLSLRRHPAMQLLFGAAAFALHRRSMRATRYSASRSPGGADLSQAVYLAFCDIFVTSDLAQCRALRMLNVLIKKMNTRVVRYEVFRSEVLS